MHGYLDLEEMRAGFVRYLRSKIGAPYRWGGQGPQVFDCSGLVCAGLQAAGLMPDGVDMTAAQLYTHYQELGHPVTHKPTTPGQLCFYGNNPSKPPHHVMVTLTAWEPDGMTILIGARGGGPSTQTLAEAYAQGAYVCTVQGTYWRQGLHGVLDPFYFKGVDK